MSNIEHGYVMDGPTDLNRKLIEIRQAVGRYMFGVATPKDIEFLEFEKMNIVIGNNPFAKAFFPYWAKDKPSAKVNEVGKEVF